MPIEFHCNHCGELVRTSAENAGKRGKCPKCHQSVYIPTPPDDIEPLRLAPVDEDEEARRKRLIEESQDLARTIRRERADLPPEPAAAQRPSVPPVDDLRLPTDMEALITDYALLMAQGKLNEAQRIATEIRKDLPRADEFIERMTMDELPPVRLSHIPRPVLQGFMKQLRSG